MSDILHVASDLSSLNLSLSMNGGLAQNFCMYIDLICFYPTPNKLAVATANVYFDYSVTFFFTMSFLNLSTSVGSVLNT